MDSDQLFIIFFLESLELLGSNSETVNFIILLAIANEVVRAIFA